MEEPKDKPKVEPKKEGDPTPAPTRIDNPEPAPVKPEGTPVEPAPKDTPDKDTPDKDAPDKDAPDKDEPDKDKDEEVTLDAYKVAVLKERIFPEEVRKDILGADTADAVDKTVEAYLRSLMDKQNDGIVPTKDAIPEEKTEEQKRNAGLYSRRL